MKGIQERTCFENSVGVVSLLFSFNSFLKEAADTTGGDTDDTSGPSGAMTGTDAEISAGNIGAGDDDTAGGAV